MNYQFIKIQNYIQLCVQCAHSTEQHAYRALIFLAFVSVLKPHVCTGNMNNYFTVDPYPHINITN